MATPTQIRRRGLASLILGTLVAAVLFAAVAYADNVKNDVVAGGSDTLTAGGSTTINYWIQPTGGTCDAADGSAAVVTISVPSGVSAAPSSLTFTACNTSGNEANPNNTQSVTFSSSTPGDYNITASVADTSGTYNASPAAFTLHVLAPADATPPVITPNIVGTLGADGWYTSDVTVSWSVVDNESAITSTSGCGPTTINSDTTGTTLTCSATSAGGTNSQSVTIKRDATNPTISGAVSPASPDGDNGWYKTAPTVTFTCSDATSGIFSCVADGTSPASDSKALGESASAQTVSGTATDNAGNSNTASVTGLMVDLSDPTVDSWTGSIDDGDSFYFGSVPAAPTCTGADAISGPKSCVVTGYSNLVGNHTLTATATDNAGRTGTDTRGYTVLAWTLNGFYQPVNMSTSTTVWNTVKNGSTVPLKFNVFAATELTDPAVVASLKYVGVACSAGDPEDPVELTTTGGTSLRYDSSAGQFVYNWQTPKKAGACYKVTVMTLDGSSLSAYFKLK